MTGNAEIELFNYTISISKIALKHPKTFTGQKQTIYE